MNTRLLIIVGITVILLGVSTLGLIVGMYIVTPVIVIIKVSKHIRK
jgi:hypothetical protein